MNPEHECNMLNLISSLSLITNIKTCNMVMEEDSDEDQINID